MTVWARWCLALFPGCSRKRPWYTLLRMHTVLTLSPLPDDLVRMVGRGWFKVILQDTRRFEIFYLSNREFQTKEELLVKLCHFAMAAFNRREVSGHCIVCTIIRDYIPQLIYTTVLYDTYTYMYML